MAKQSGIFPIEGSLDNVTFLKRSGTFMIRKKGGVSKSRIMNDPAFKRTRENVSEFGHVASAGKLVRTGGAQLIQKAYDPKLSNRLMKLLTKVKNCDPSMPRGKRQVHGGLTTAEGLALLSGFDFNERSTLSAVLFAPTALTEATGKITIPNLVPADMMHYPAHATHVSFRSGILRIDFEQDAATLVMSPVTNLPIDMSETSVSLTPTALPAGTGVKMHLLLVEFYQEINGDQYLLNDGKFNVLGTVWVSTTA
ncbi:hypothetical protein [Flavobacterium sp. 3HN19-14]|uniref:hypothetical protein n=1 Tax=Flavobacterium sp. 3HN19-14 TaxID=3448133 RepID=UPI003EDF136F